MLHQNAYIRRCEVLLRINLILYSIYESESNAFELVQRQYVSDNVSFFQFRSYNKRDSVKCLLYVDLVAVCKLLGCRNR